MEQGWGAGRFRHRDGDGWCGAGLCEFDVLTWFGLNAPEMQAFDSGYGYILSKVGVIGFWVLWLIPFSFRNADRHFCLHRNLLAVSYGTILCVSNSAFTIKTAALAWVLFEVMRSCRGSRYARRAVVMAGNGRKNARSNQFG
ncbi:MAG: hypothetical protein AB1490_05410 [Pseudomonadota bacterium]